MLDVAEDKSAGDLGSYDSWRNQPPGTMKVLKKSDAWQDVRRLGTRMQLHIGIHNAGRSVIARKFGACWSTASVRVSISMPALATQ